jgi:transcription elongation factor GreA
VIESSNKLVRKWTHVAGLFPPVGEENAEMRNELTRRDIEEMEKEIEYRRTVVRKEALEEVKETRAHGDLSENFEYHAAKKVKNQNESRIRYLDRMIRTAKIIEETPQDVAGVDRRVTVDKRGKEITYTLVSTVRQNSLKKMISVESPIGRALLGHRAGDTVTVRVSDEVQYPLTILSVEDAAEAREAELRKY